MATKELIIEALKKEIEALGAPAEVKKVGTVIEVGDGIATMTGLTDCKVAEMLEFPGNTFGVVLNLEDQTVGAMILGDYQHIRKATPLLRPAGSFRFRFRPRWSVG